MKRKSHRWEDALNTFLLKWREKPEVIGALVSGSRILGTDTPNSDIDVHIVLSDQATWRERGNCIIDGYLVEYFCNPAIQLAQYSKEDFSNFNRQEARMWACGEIIFDKNGTLRRLQKGAKKELKAKFRKLSKPEIELGKYSVWDQLDNLKDLSEGKSAFYCYSHHLLLNHVLDLYRRYLGIEVSSSAKLERYFTDKEFRKSYSIEEFKDKHFVQLFLKAVKKPTFKSAERIVEHVLEQMGGFDIDGWKFRSKISV